VEDLSDFELSQYQLRYAGKESYNNAQCNVIEAVVIGKSNLYSKKRIFIDEKNNLVQRVDYLDSSEKLTKQYRLLSLQEVDGKQFPAQCEMETLKSKSSTAITFSNINIKEIAFGIRGC